MAFDAKKRNWSIIFSDTSPITSFSRGSSISDIHSKEPASPDTSHFQSYPIAIVISYSVQKAKE